MTRIVRHLVRAVRHLVHRPGPGPRTRTITAPHARTTHRGAPPLPPLPGEYLPGAPDAGEHAIRGWLQQHTAPGGTQ